MALPSQTSHRGVREPLRGCHAGAHQAARLGQGDAGAPVATAPGHTLILRSRPRHYADLETATAARYLNAFHATDTLADVWVAYLRERGGYSDLPEGPPRQPPVMAPNPDSTTCHRSPPRGPREREVPRAD